MDKKNIIFLIFGLVIGTATGYVVAKNKYEKEFQDALNELWDERHENRRSTEEELDEVEEFSEEERQSYVDIVHEEYVENTSENLKQGPYLIGIDDYYNEFGDVKYEKKMLIYYEDDGVLIDENEDTIDNLDQVIGRESLEHIGDYEDDRIYIRNEWYGTDFEVVVEHSAYADIFEDT